VKGILNCGKIGCLGQRNVNCPKGRIGKKGGNNGGPPICWGIKGGGRNTFLGRPPQGGGIFPKTVGGKKYI